MFEVNSTGLSRISDDYLFQCYSHLRSILLGKFSLLKFFTRASKRLRETTVTELESMSKIQVEYDSIYHKLKSLPGFSNEGCELINGLLRVFDDDHSKKFNELKNLKKIDYTEIDEIGLIFDRIKARLHEMDQKYGNQGNTGHFRHLNCKSDIETYLSIALFYDLIIEKMDSVLRVCNGELAKVCALGSSRFANKIFDSISNFSLENEKSQVEYLERMLFLPSNQANPGGIGNDEPLSDIQVYEASNELDLTPYSFRSSPVCSSLDVSSLGSFSERPGSNISGDKTYLKEKFRTSRCSNMSLPNSTNFSQKSPRKEFSRAKANVKFCSLSDPRTGSTRARSPTPAEEFNRTRITHEDRRRISLFNPISGHAAQENNSLVQPEISKSSSSPRSRVFMRSRKNSQKEHWVPNAEHISKQKETKVKRKYQSLLKNVDTDKVPPVIQAFVDYLLKFGLSEEGILRVSGNQREIQQLLYRQDTHASEKFINGDINVNSVAGALKSYLREGDVRVISLKMQDFLVETIEPEDEEANIVELVSDKLHTNSYISRQQFQTLRLILLLCSEIVNNQDLNKMNKKNLSLVFGISLFRREVGPRISCKILQFLITNFENIFRISI